MTHSVQILLMIPAMNICVQASAQDVYGFSNVAHIIHPKGGIKPFPTSQSLWVQEYMQAPFASTVDVEK